MRAATILNLLAAAAAVSAHTIFQQIAINGVAQDSMIPPADTVGNFPIDHDSV